MPMRSSVRTVSAEWLVSGRPMITTGSCAASSSISFTGASGPSRISASQRKSPRAAIASASGRSAVEPERTTS